MQAPTRIRRFPRRSACFLPSNWFERDAYELRHPVFPVTGPAAHPHRLWFRGASAAQGLPADRLRRGPLRRRAEARRLRAGAADAGVPPVRLPVALGGDGLRAARRREGEGVRRRRHGRATDPQLHHQLRSAASGGAWRAAPRP